MTTPYIGPNSLSKLSSIVKSELNSKADASSISTVGHTGDYDDLSNKPTIDTILNTQSSRAIANSTVTSSLHAITAKIPNEASSSNQLADKNFVNSSIATQTSYFRGTSATGLTEAQFLAWANSLNKTPNDYVFWQTLDGSGNLLYKRYKYTGSTWQFEYDLNNSSFTAVQWAAINSGATSQNVSSFTSHLSNTSNPHGTTASQVGAAPTDHSSTATTYGVASSTKYGHVKVDTALSSTSTNPLQNKAINTALGTKENTSNKVTSLSASSTNTQYPSAKCVYDAIQAGGGGGGGGAGLFIATYGETSYADIKAAIDAGKVVKCSYVEDGTTLVILDLIYYDEEGGWVEFTQSYLGYSETAYVADDDEWAYYDDRAILYNDDPERYLPAMMINTTKIGLAFTTFNITSSSSGGNYSMNFMDGVGSYNLSNKSASTLDAIFTEQDYNTEYAFWGPLITEQVLYLNPTGSGSTSMTLNCNVSAMNKNVAFKLHVCNIGSKSVSLVFRHNASTTLGYYRDGKTTASGSNLTISISSGTSIEMVLYRGEDSSSKATLYLYRK